MGAPAYTFMLRRREDVNACSNVELVERLTSRGRPRAAARSYAGTRSIGLVCGPDGMMMMTRIFWGPGL